MMDDWINGATGGPVTAADWPDELADWPNQSAGGLWKMAVGANGAAD